MVFCLGGGGGGGGGGGTLVGHHGTGERCKRRVGHRDMGTMVPGNAVRGGLGTVIRTLLWGGSTRMRVGYRDTRSLQCCPRAS